MSRNAKLGRVDRCCLGRGQAFPGKNVANARAWHQPVEAGRQMDGQDQSGGSWVTVQPAARLAL